MAANELQEYYAKSRTAWRQWLEKNHAKKTGVWLIYYKKNSGKPSVPYAEAVEEALCFGWIDSIMKPVDDAQYKQKFTPRNPKSEWSALNKSRVEKLRREGKMHASGEAAIKAAMESGGWTKIDHVENLEVPADLQKAFARNKKAALHFEKLSKSVKKQWLHRLGSAKLPDTRKRRIEQILQLVKNV